MDINSKTKLSSLCLAVALISGCTTVATSSSGNSVGPPSIVDISVAKTGLCNNPFTFEQATRYVGIDPTKSPQEREAEKQAAWSSWLAAIASNKSNVQSARDEFAIEHTAAFYPDSDKDGIIEFAGGGTTKYEVEGLIKTYQSAIPDLITFNLGRSFGGPGVPLGAVEPVLRGDFKYKQGVRARRIDEIRHQFYGNSGKAADDIYVINDTYTSSRTSSTSATEAKYGGNKRLSGKPMFGVNLITKRWYESPQSFIKKSRDGSFVFDTTHFDFVDTFGYYPDAKEVFVNVAYIFEMSHCSGVDLYGDVKEVVVSTQDGNEIYRVSL